MDYVAFFLKQSSENLEGGGKRQRQRSQGLACQKDQGQGTKEGRWFQKGSAWRQDLQSTDMEDAGQLRDAHMRLMRDAQSSGKHELLK